MRPQSGAADCSAADSQPVLEAESLLDPLHYLFHVVRVRWLQRTIGNVVTEMSHGMGKVRRLCQLAFVEDNFMDYSVFVGRMKAHVHIHFTNEIGTDQKTTGKLHGFIKSFIVEVRPILGWLGFSRLRIVGKAVALLAGWQLSKYKWAFATLGK